MSFNENDFFATMLINGEIDSFIDLRRKKPTYPGNIEALIDVLASDLSKELDSLYILISPFDHYLSKDLQALGFVFDGYLARNDQTGRNGDELILWDESGFFKRMSIAEVARGTSSSLKVARSVLTMSRDLTHYPTTGWRDYLSICEYSERYFLGLTQINSDWAKSNPFVKKSGAIVPECKRSDDSFTGVTKGRKSAIDFQPTSVLNKTILMNILADSFYTRDIGTKPFGTAGGIGAYDLYLSIELNNDLACGFYKVPGDENSLVRISEENHNELFFNASFACSHYKDAKIWLLVAANPHYLMNKYGKRGRQFMFVDTGGLLQQLHLSCTSFGINFRIVGGFDHGIVKTIVPGDSIITSMAIMG